MLIFGVLHPGLISFQRHWPQEHSLHKIKDMYVDTRAPKFFFSDPDPRIRVGGLRYLEASGLGSCHEGSKHTEAAHGYVHVLEVGNV